MSSILRLGFAVVAFSLAGCGGSELRPIQGTTTRIGKPTVAEGTELELKIFTDEIECRGKVKPDEVELCLPRVDRHNGEVRLAFQLRLDSDPFPVPLSKEHLQIAHLGTVVQDGAYGQSYTVVPHDPVRAEELFILVIDGSSSMLENDRMEKVRRALMLQTVKESFFPQDVRTGVILLQFTSGSPQPVGGALKIIENARDYTQAVRDDLRVLSGYTHLYDAIRYASGELLQEPMVKDYLDLHEAAPTIVALTDGFNNMSHGDSCRTNAERLEVLLKHLVQVRGGEGEEVDIRSRPTVYTVGLGKPLRPNFELPDEKGTRVRPRDLCGTRYVDRRIDGDLERLGIDNASLEWIAARGGGFSYVRRDRDGLGAAFMSAAAERYYWFEARYRLDPHYLRRSFGTTLRLIAFARAEASVRIHPSAWLDGPPGRRGADGWSMQRPIRHTWAVLMPILGVLLGASVVGASMFNVHRVITRSGRAPPRSAATTVAPPPAPGSAPPPPPS
ncbi:MAG: VWA domain-containing protein [Myxococcota bacterium]|nr:VWA domain-containing protein [Myxococcota bacterium]